MPARTIVKAMLAAAALVAPLVALEMRFGGATFSSLASPLFVLLWLVATAFAIVAAPLIRAALAGEGLLARPGVLAARVGFLVLAAGVWIVIVQDQWPCFLGVPNCD